MSVSKTQEIIESYYKFFNASELDKISSLIDEDMIHEINYVCCDRSQ